MTFRISPNDTITDFVDPRRQLLDLVFPNRDVNQQNAKSNGGTVILRDTPKQNDNNPEVSNNSEIYQTKFYGDAILRGTDKSRVLSGSSEINREARDFYGLVATEFDSEVHTCAIGSLLIGAALTDIEIDTVTTTKYSKVVGSGQAAIDPGTMVRIYRLHFRFHGIEMLRQQLIPFVRQFALVPFVPVFIPNQGERLAEGVFELQQACQLALELVTVPDTPNAVDVVLELTPFQVSKFVGLTSVQDGDQTKIDFPPFGSLFNADLCRWWITDYYNYVKELGGAPVLTNKQGVFNLYSIDPGVRTKLNEISVAMTNFIAALQIGATNLEIPSFVNEGMKSIAYAYASPETYYKVFSIPPKGAGQNVTPLDPDRPDSVFPVSGQTAPDDAAKFGSHEFQTNFKNLILEVVQGIVDASQVESLARVAQSFENLADKSGGVADNIEIDDVLGLIDQYEMIWNDNIMEGSGDWAVERVNYRLENKFSLSELQSEVDPFPQYWGLGDSVMTIEMTSDRGPIEAIHSKMKDAIQWAKGGTPTLDKIQDLGFTEFDTPLVVKISCMFTDIVGHRHFIPLDITSKTIKGVPNKWNSVVRFQAHYSPTLSGEQLVVDNLTDNTAGRKGVFLGGTASGSAGKYNDSDFSLWDWYWPWIHYQERMTRKNLYTDLPLPTWRDVFDSGQSWYNEAMLFSDLEESRWTDLNSDPVAILLAASEVQRRVGAVADPDFYMKVPKFVGYSREIIDGLNTSTLTSSVSSLKATNDFDKNRGATATAVQGSPGKFVWESRDGKRRVIYDVQTNTITAKVEPSLVANLISEAKGFRLGTSIQRNKQFDHALYVDDYTTSTIGMNVLDEQVKHVKDEYTALIAELDRTIESAKAKKRDTAVLERIRSKYDRASKSIPYVYVNGVGQLLTPETQSFGTISSDVYARVGEVWQEEILNHAGTHLDLYSLLNGLDNRQTILLGRQRSADDNLTAWRAETVVERFSGGIAPSDLASETHSLYSYDPVALAAQRIVEECINAQCAFVELHNPKSIIESSNGSVLDDLKQMPADEMSITQLEWTLAKDAEDNHYPIVVPPQGTSAPGAGYANYISEVLAAKQLHQSVNQGTFETGDHFIDEEILGCKFTMLRGFPSMMLSIIDRQQLVMGYKIHDSHYGGLTVTSCDVVSSHDDPIPVATVRIANHSGKAHNDKYSLGSPGSIATLLTQQFSNDLFWRQVRKNLISLGAGDYNLVKWGYRSIEEGFRNFGQGIADYFEGIWDLWTGNLVEEREKLEDIRQLREFLSIADISPGAGVEIKMGYGQTANLPTIFNGVVSQAGGGADFDVFCQGFGQELTKKIEDAVVTGIQYNDGEYRPYKSTALVFNTMEGTELKRWMWRYQYWPQMAMRMTRYGAPSFGLPEPYMRNILWNKDFEQTNLNSSLSQALAPGFVEGPVPASLPTYDGNDGTVGKYYIDTFRLFTPYTVDQDALNVQTECLMNVFPTSKNAARGKYGLWRGNMSDVEPKLAVDIGKLSLWEFLQTAKRYTGDYYLTTLPFMNRQTLFFGKTGWPVYHRYSYISQDVFNTLNQTIGRDLDQSLLFEDLADGDKKLTVPRLLAVRKPFDQVCIHGDWDIVKNDIETTDNFYNVTEINRPEVGLFTQYLDYDIIPASRRKKIIDPSTFAWNGGQEMTINSILRGYLKEECERIYDGELTVIGNPAIRSGTTGFVFDSVQKVSGPIVHRKVIHSFRPNSGYNTFITPGAIVGVQDEELFARISSYFSKAAYYVSMWASQAFIGAAVSVLAYAALVDVVQGLAFSAGTARGFFDVELANQAYNRTIATRLKSLDRVIGQLQGKRLLLIEESTQNFRPIVQIKDLEDEIARLLRTKDRLVTASRRRWANQLTPDLLFGSKRWSERFSDFMRPSSEWLTERFEKTWLGRTIAGFGEQLGTIVGGKLTSAAESNVLKAFGQRLKDILSSAAPGFEELRAARLGEVAAAGRQGAMEAGVNSLRRELAELGKKRALGLGERIVGGAAKIAGRFGSATETFRSIKLAISSVLRPVSFAGGPAGKILYEIGSWVVFETIGALIMNYVKENEKSKRACYIFPLTRKGLEWVGGMDGHRGSTIYSSQSFMDMFVEKYVYGTFGHPTNKYQFESKANLDGWSTVSQGRYASPTNSVSELLTQLEQSATIAQSAEDLVQHPPYADKLSSVTADKNLGGRAAFTVTDPSKGAERVISPPGTDLTPQEDKSLEETENKVLSPRPAYTNDLSGGQGKTPSIWDNQPFPTIAKDKSSDDHAIPILPEFARPVSYASPVTSSPGNRPSPGHDGSTKHKGIDFGRTPGNAATIVVAAQLGKVVKAYRSSTYGNCVMMSHVFYDKIKNDKMVVLYTVYAHLKKFVVKVGDILRVGDTIGEMGDTGRATGVHLHFEIGSAYPDQGSEIWYNRDVYEMVNVDDRKTQFKQIKKVVF